MSSILAPSERNPRAVKRHHALERRTGPDSALDRGGLRPPHVSGYAAIVSLYGEHDLSTSAELTAALAPLDGNLLIDMSACEFIDSSVITALLGKSHELIREGHRLELLVPSGNRMVGRVVDVVVGLRTLVPVLEQLPATGTAPELDATASPLERAGQSDVCSARSGDALRRRGG